MSTIRPGYLKQFAEYLGISRQAAKKHLDRAGVNYRESFDFEKVARILDTYRHLGRDSYRKRIVKYPDFEALVVFAVVQGAICDKSKASVWQVEEPSRLRRIKGYTLRD